MDEVPEAEPEGSIMGTERDSAFVENDDEQTQRRFASVRVGLDPEEVDDFLAAIASSIEALESELRRTQLISDRRSERAARLVEVGEREIERWIDDTEVEAATIVSGATEEADRIASEARSAAERSREEAVAGRAQAEEGSSRMLGDLEGRRRLASEDFREMRERLLRAARDLEPD